MELILLLIDVVDDRAVTIELAIEDRRSTWRVEHELVDDARQMRVIHLPRDLRHAIDNPLVAAKLTTIVGNFLSGLKVGLPYRLSPPDG